MNNLEHKKMSGSDYLQNILIRKACCSETERLNQYNLVKGRLMPIINQWSNGYLEEVFQSGSSAKGTAIKGKSDVDVFISIKSSCDVTLQKIYETLGEAVRQAGYNIRHQNVSIGLKVGNIDVDLVPGKKDPGNTNYHKLYVSKKQSWMQTNVKLQIQNIKNSHRAKFIQLTKIRRDCHRLDFPSMNIELIVLEALRGYSYDTSLTDGFLQVLRYIEDKILDSYLIDPGNSGNIISDDMTFQDKLAVQQKARNSLSQQYWSSVVW